MRYDVAVIGLGGMGSAILAHAAARGAKAIGFEQFSAGHERGSSHGRSRMIRKAYFEDAAYVPLLHRAFELWAILEEQTRAKILQTTGVLTVGAEGSRIVEGTRRAAVEHELSLEVLSRGEMQRRYPAVRFGNGERVSAAALVLTMGPWLRETFAALGVPLRIQRNVQVWFNPETTVYQAPNFPAFLLDRPGLPAPLYGFPDFGDGVKAAFHGSQDFTTAEELDRSVDPVRDIEPLERALEEWMPGAAARWREANVCMYSLTPDENFVVDRHPVHPRLILCGGFSGHGFKFASVIGEIGAELALDGGTRHDIDFLSLRRFRNGIGNLHE
ncbi:MAG: FAD-dependent oxidoreductase [Chthoniobacterales bacterium]